jgi:hypothetical protein
MNLSVPLVLEYEDVLFRKSPGLGIDRQVVESLLDFHCVVARRHHIFFLWRPFLRDPKDEMILELASKARVEPEAYDRLPDA